MPIPVGTKFGPYEIVAPLGSGGMGEVYRARDTRLDRSVAIKILPAHLSDNAEAKQRFEREARAISSLNHANICTLYDVGNQDGAEYIVMELLEGTTLAGRLTRGPLPTDQVLRYGMEICEGLERAHRNGVVHRDLKPANVMLTKSGAKLMDFGLAKTTGPAVRLTDSSVTMTSAVPGGSQPLTAAGTVLGTFQYMSPEQVEGKEADQRSDIFSLGAMLYEMATGKRAFEGKTPASVIGAILERDPAPVSSVQASSPVALDRIVKTCLAKDPDDRFQSVHDVKLQLKWAGEASPITVGAAESGVNAAAAPDAVAAKNAWLPWAVAGVATLAALALAVGLLMRKPAQQRSVRAEINTGGELQFGTFGPTNGGFAVSPDSTHVVFSASQGGVTALYLRALDSTTAEKLAGTEDGNFPFWSPDSKSIGFFAMAKLKKVQIGGSPVALCDAPSGRGGAWNREGVIIFTPDINQPLYRISDAGGQPTAITALDKSHDEYSNRWPQFLPDQRHFLFLSVTPIASLTTSEVPGNEKDSLRVGDIGSSNQYTAIRLTASQGEYASGYLLFCQADGTLMAQPFDAAKLKLNGEPAAVAHGVLRMPTLFHSFFSTSPDGILTYAQAAATPSQPILLLDRTGHTVQTIPGGVGVEQPRFSPDGKKISFDATAQTSDVWIYDLARSIKSRITFAKDGRLSADAIWSPDGRRIAYGSYHPGSYGVRISRTDGSGGEEAFLPDDIMPKWPSDWSRDGKYMALTKGSSLVYGHLMIAPLSGNEKTFAPASVTEGDAVHRDPHFSPDGKWISYTSTDSGQSEVYVTPFPGLGAKTQISPEGGSAAVWRADGKEIFFLGPPPDNWMTVVPVSEKSGEIEFGKPQKLFVTRPSNRNPFDVSPDGQRIAFVSAGDARPSPIVVVTNWTEALAKQ